MTLSGVPGVPTTNPGFTAMFGSPDPLATFRCALDNGAFGPCMSGMPRTVADGPHTFRVFAVDPSGNQSNTLVANWVVDRQPPQMTINGPGRSGANATFAFGANEPATFQCKLDNAAFGPCTTGNSVTFTNLSEGQHTFTLRATDSLGNAAESAPRAWTVDRTPPGHSIASGPAEGSSVATPAVAFEFSATEATATFECSIDGAAFAVCPNPFTTAALATGDHSCACARRTTSAMSTRRRRRARGGRTSSTRTAMATTARRRTAMTTTPRSIRRH